MAFVIIDLEFNNLEGITKYYPNIYEDNPKFRSLDLQNEIIEIGAIKLDNHMKALKEFKTFIKPSAISILNPKISEITNIKIEDLENGISLEEGLNELSNLIDDGDIICSWAKDDIIEIVNNAVYYNYTNLGWLKNYLDLQDYSTKILAKKKKLSLKNALEELKIKIDNNKLHDALNDAVFTAEVFKRIYNSRAIKGHIIKDVYNMPAVEIKDLKKFNIDKDKINHLCPKCNVKFKIEYDCVPMKWRFLSLGKCPKCNSNIINELIVKKTFSGEDIYNEKAIIIDEVEYIDYSYKLKNIEN